MKTTYTQAELDELAAAVQPRNGWDFSRMHTVRQPVPWDYADEVKRYLNPSDTVLDIGTGGGERFTQLADSFKQGLGTDIDPVMVETAQQKCQAKNVTFAVSSDKLEDITDMFDVMLNRHSPFTMNAVKSHLKADGYFITQQVGERNMANVKAALGQAIADLVVSKDNITSAGLKLLAFMEYDVEYVVKDIESLIFWLNALDMLHAGMDGAKGLKDAAVLNHILEGNVDDRGFTTNEHRYLVIAQNA